jgi:hypothetical protein
MNAICHTRQCNAVLYRLYEQQKMGTSKVCWNFMAPHHQLASSGDVPGILNWDQLRRDSISLFNDVAGFVQAFTIHYWESPTTLMLGKEGLL